MIIAQKYDQLVLFTLKPFKAKWNNYKFEKGIVSVYLLMKKAVLITSSW